MADLILSVLIIVFVVVFHRWVVICIAGLVGALVIGPLGGVIIGALVFGYMKATQEEEPPS